MSESSRGPEDAVVTRASLPDVLRSLNRMRVAPDATLRREVEALADTLFGASQRLIAYGSLMPGGGHEEELAGLQGEWHAGWITGTLVEHGWGASLGYPALIWNPDSDRRVAAQLFTSPDLRHCWDRLDLFEGESYQRILVPFYDDAGFVAVGNLYELGPTSV
jgi:gamma-glutamylcyclotransferase (GGCT)/AIG2-like uncharacterized protein YtfP